MPAARSLDPNFTPGNRLSRLPVRTGEESLEDFYRDLFANAAPDQEQQRLLRALDEDLTDGAAAKGSAQALDHLDRAFRRIETWTSWGDPLPAADRTELKRRVAHNLLSVRPGLVLADQSTPAPDRALLREVQDEHAVWRQGWTIGPENAPYGRRPQPESFAPRRPWDEQPDSGRPRQPWDERPGPGQSGDEPPSPREPGWARALRRLGNGEPLDPEADGAARDSARSLDERAGEQRKTYWIFLPEPTACERCLEMAGRVYTEKPERPHPHCKCEIESRAMTAREVRAFLGAQAVRADAIRTERERIKQEMRAARIKARTPAHVDDSQWHGDGDPVTVTGKDKNGQPVRRTFKGHALPEKTPEGVEIKTTPNTDPRVAKEMGDTLQAVLDDPRCKEAGIKEVTLSATTNGKHEKPDDRHYDGKAVDVAEINGKPIGKDEKAQEQAKVLQDVIEGKAKQKGEIKDNLGPKYNRIYDTNGKEIPSRGKVPSHDDHVHIAIW